MRAIRCVGSLAVGAVVLGASMLSACAASTDEPLAPAAQPSTAPVGGEGDGDAALQQATRLERRLARMKERLELTDDQVEQLRPIVERMREARREVRELPREERRAAKRALWDGFRSELEGVLTPEQLERAERMLRHHGRRGRRGPPDPDRMLQRMQTHLELTDAQVEQVRPILHGAHERRKALRDLPREERREARRALRDEVRGQLARVLTPEQLAELERRWEQRRGCRHRR